MACWRVGTQILFFPRAYMLILLHNSPIFFLCPRRCQLGFSLTTLFLLHKVLPIVFSDSLLQCTWPVQTHTLSESNGIRLPPPLPPSPPLQAVSPSFSGRRAKLTTKYNGVRTHCASLKDVSGLWLSSFPFSSLLLTWTWGVGRRKGEYSSGYDQFCSG